jgi:biopolymer transport protein ExbD
MKKRQFSFETGRPRIEIIPMIDIMMFLLVFFIIITLKMIAGTGIKLDLPGSHTAQPLDAPKVTIGVDKDGKLYNDGQATTPELLASQLRAAHAQGPKLEVVIAGDRKVELQRLIEVMDIVRSAGIGAVGIVTRSDNQ